eukprot:tig00000204_g17782.t1
MARAGTLVALVALLACAGICVAADAPSSAAAPQKVVQVSLKATWESTPVLLEASEAVAGIGGEELFWDFAAAVAGGAGEGASAREAYEKAALPAAESLLSGDELSLLKIALAVREKSPAVQAQFELSADVCQRLYYRGAVAAEAKGGKAPEGPVAVPPLAFGAAWATVGSEERVAGSAAELEAALGSATADGSSPRLYEHDHVLRPPGSGASTPLVVLYGRLGSPALAPLYAAAAALAKQGKAIVVLRHFRDCSSSSPGQSVGKPMALQGYGVEMAIKNMEYIAIDDANVTGKAVDMEAEGASSDADASSAVQEGVESYLFEALIKKKPSRRAALAALREEVASGAMASRRLTEKQLRELGIQAAQAVGSAEDPLRLLRDVAWNAPLLAPVLYRLGVDSAVRQEVAATGRSFRAGDSRLFLNGRELDADTTDPFKLLDAIREELALVRRLRPLRLAPKSLQRVMGAGVSAREGGAGGASSAIRVDHRDDSVLYLNDVENDKQYSRWPRSLSELLAPTWPGQFRQIRRNIYTAVFVVDLGTTDGAALVARLSRYIQNNAPVRFGVVAYPATRALSPSSDPAAAAAAAAAAGPAAREAGRRRLRALLGSESAVSEVLAGPAGTAAMAGGAHPGAPGGLGGALHAEADGELCTAPSTPMEKPPCAEDDEAKAAEEEGEKEEAEAPPALKYEQTASLAAAKAFHYFAAQGRPWALAFASQLAAAKGPEEDEMENPGAPPPEGPLALDEVKTAFERTLAAPPLARNGKKVPLKRKASFEEVTEEGGEYEAAAAAGLGVVKRAGLENAPLPVMFVNGRPFSGREVEGRLFEALQEEMVMLQTLVHTGAIPDKTEDILDAIFSGANGKLSPALRRYRSSLFPDEPSARHTMEPPPGEEGAEAAPQFKYVPLAPWIRPAAPSSDLDLDLDLGEEEDEAAKPAKGAE